MAKPQIVPEPPDDEVEEDDEEETFKMFGIEDDKAKSRIRELSAARVLAYRKLNPKKKKEKPKDENSPWGQE